MKSVFLLSALTFPSIASAGLNCGGNYSGEELAFSRNPINNIFSGKSKDETLFAYIDATRGEKIRIVLAETVKDAEWEKLKTLRDMATETELQELISRLGSTKVTDIWMGWTPDNFVHIEGTQRNLKFTLSCKKD